MTEDMNQTTPPDEIIHEGGERIPNPELSDSAIAATPTFVVFDTETTGLFLFRDKETGEPVPADDPRQPRLASAAFILCDDAGCEISREKRIIKPDGWSMAEYDAIAIADGKKPASEINGLTDEFLNENGVPVSDVLDMWEGYITSGLIAVAHNSQFDSKMMRAELRRADRPDLFEETRQTCTMRSCKPYQEQGMPIKRGQFVSLQDACNFFGIVLTDAHDAMADAVACREILARLLRDGNLIEPKVHYAKPAGGAE